MCQTIEIGKTNVWWIRFNFQSIAPNHQCDYSIGRFNTVLEAREVLDEIWDAYQKGQPYYEPDLREKFNVRIGNKWDTEEEPIHTYFQAIERLGLEEIYKRELLFKDKYVEGHEGVLIVVKKEDKTLRQSQLGDYYILKLERLTTMKETLEYIANELNVDIKITIYE